MMGNICKIFLKLFVLALALSVSSLLFPLDDPFLLHFFIGKDGRFWEKVEGKANPGVARVCPMCNVYHEWQSTFIT